VEEQKEKMKVLLDEHRRELESKDVLLKGLEEERSKSVYLLILHSPHTPLYVTSYCCIRVRGRVLRSCKTRSRISSASSKRSRTNARPCNRR
jgi:hypothetical protein